MKIKSINKIKYTVFVYNFSVSDNHNYIVNNVIASNCHYCYTNCVFSPSLVTTFLFSKQKL